MFCRSRSVRAGSFDYWSLSDGDKARQHVLRIMRGVPLARWADEIGAVEEGAVRDYVSAHLRGIYARARERLVTHMRANVPQVTWQQEIEKIRDDGLRKYVRKTLLNY